MKCTFYLFRFSSIIFAHTLPSSQFLLLFGKFQCERPLTVRTASEERVDQDEAMIDQKEKERQGFR